MFGTVSALATYVDWTAALTISAIGVIGIPVTTTLVRRSHKRRDAIATSITTRNAIIDEKLGALTDTMLGKPKTLEDPAGSPGIIEKLDSFSEVQERQGIIISKLSTTSDKHTRALNEINKSVNGVKPGAPVLRETSEETNRLVKALIESQALSSATADTNAEEAVSSRHDLSDKADRTLEALNDAQ